MKENGPRSQKNRAPLLVLEVTSLKTLAKYLLLLVISISAHVKWSCGKCRTG